MKKVVVTGGAGFLGSHLCRSFIAKDYFVYCVDNLITGNKDNISSLVANKNFEFIEHDVINGLPDQIEEADYVFHMASPASPNHHSELSYFSLPIQTMDVNTLGTHNILKFCEAKNAHFLFASTSEIYGDPLVHPQSEDYRGNVSTIGPRSIYDEAKRFGETLTAYYSNSGRVNARIARIFNTYGPNMSKPDMRMIITFVNQALNNEPITVFGDGEQTRSLCYVDDLIDGLTKLMLTEGTNGEVINLGSDKEYTVLEYAQMVKDAIGSNSEIVLSEELPKDDPLKRRPDLSKAKKILEWEPTTDFKTGLHKTIEYFKQ